MYRSAAFFFATLLGFSAQVLAFDSSDPFSINAPTEKPAKAPREKNDGHWLENQINGFAAGAAAGAVNNVVFGGAAAALNPLVALPTIAVVGVKMIEPENRS